ncbi:Alpha carbonic anhydrase 1, chloroplastic [Linum perenne]
MGSTDPTLLFTYSVLLAAIALFSSAQAGSAPSGVVNFGYTGPKGPLKWGSLSPNYKECDIGKLQSPIDINRQDVVENKKLERLKGNYVAVNATLINTGRSIMVHYDDLHAGELEVDGKTYKLQQMHWHSPSEHTFDGHQYPLELHLVHQSDDGIFTVVSVLHEYGPNEDSLIKKEKKSLKSSKQGRTAAAASEPPQVKLRKKIEYKMLKKKTHKYYRYTGSLTSPPCTQNVTWNILAKVRSVSPEQVKALKDLLSADCKANARPIQPLNGRKVEVYKEPNNL